MNSQMTRIRHDLSVLEKYLLTLSSRLQKAQCLKHQLLSEYETIDRDLALTDGRYQVLDPFLGPDTKRVKIKVNNSEAANIAWQKMSSEEQQQVLASVEV